MIMRAIPPCSFQVGDRVIVIADHLASNNRSICRGDVGTVCNILGAYYEAVYGETYLVGISFDKHVSGHDCEETCEFGHGWYVRDYEISRLVDIERDYPDVEIATDEELFAFLGVK